MGRLYSFFLCVPMVSEAWARRLEELIHPELLLYTNNGQRVAGQFGPQMVEWELPKGTSPKTVWAAVVEEWASRFRRPSLPAWELTSGSPAYRLVQVEGTEVCVGPGVHPAQLGHLTRAIRALPAPPPRVIVVRSMKVFGPGSADAKGAAFMDAVAILAQPRIKGVPTRAREYILAHETAHLVWYRLAEEWRARVIELWLKSPYIKGFERDYSLTSPWEGMAEFYAWYTHGALPGRLSPEQAEIVAITISAAKEMGLVKPRRTKGYARRPSSARSSGGKSSRRVDPGRSKDHRRKTKKPRR